MDYLEKYKKGELTTTSNPQNGMQMTKGSGPNKGGAEEKDDEKKKM